ncbi:MAG: hypothetical protein LQ344_004690 [Seirophora lacunosa]|nr:MAG: hypothetical protein LQ344_004690 [Seirophora lacunosa]
METLKFTTYYRLEGSYRSPEPRTEIPHGDWEPSGLAVHEERSEVFVAIGYHRQLKGSREGLVTLYDVKLPAAIRATTTRKYKLPMGDFPRSLLFDSHGESLTCITEIRNLILVWKLADPNPFVCSRYQHQPETDSAGVTSAIIYKSRSEQAYILCSTSASTERYKSKGDWSFTSPVTATNEDMPSTSVHEFVNLQAYRHLVAGAVSSVANIYAVLEKSGKIVILRLTGHEEGGICSRDEAPRKLRASLCGTRGLRASASCLRFDPEGKRLFAVDPEGTLLIVRFRPED